MSPATEAQAGDVRVVRGAAVEGGDVRALTLTQPYATLVAIGAKKIETRGWGTGYRGPLAIHAAKGLGPVGGQRGLKELCGVEPFCTVLNAAMKAWDTPPKSLREMVERPFMPFGAIVAVCELKTIARIDYFKADPDAIYQPEWGGPFLNYGIGGLPLPDEPERSFGDYSVGRYAWELINIRALPEPIPAKGALGLWEVDL